MSDTDNKAVVSRRRVGPVGWLLDQVGSIWFGVSMLVLIFIYSSIGSAAPPIRQGAMADWFGLEFLRFEKTEMEWFTWWPFTTMVVLFCLAMIIITIRRIPLTVVNAGVWAIHSGIVMMAVYSIIYFGTKIEGDALLYQSRALIRGPGMSEAASLVIRPDASISVGAGQKHYHIRVAEIAPGTPLLNEKYKGEKAQRIQLLIEPFRGQTFYRTLFVGYPDLTEDMIVGEKGPQRAPRDPQTGTRLADRELEIKLAYDPVEHFYHAHMPQVRSTGALYARFEGQKEWHQLRFRNLPNYYEWLSSRNEIWPVQGEKLPALRPLDLHVEVPAGVEGLEGMEFRVTDYLPYAQLERRWIKNGRTLDPLLRFYLEGQSSSQSYEMRAFDPERNRMRLKEIDFNIDFMWADSVAQRQAWVRPREPKITVRVEPGPKEQTLELKRLSDAGEQGLAVEGTDYTVAVTKILPLDMRGTGSRSVVLLRVRQGATAFDRMVIVGDKSGGTDLDEGGKPKSSLADPNVRFEYSDPSPQQLLFVGGPDADTVDVVFSRMDGTYHHHEARVDESFNLVGDSWPMKIEELYARSDERPMIVPRNQRQSLQEVGRTQSLVRVELNDGRATQSLWLPFNQYVFEDEQRARPRFFPRSIRDVHLSDGRVLELMYSRWRDPLPSKVALDRFVLQTYPGGDRPSDFISFVRFWENEAWSDLLEVKSNHPAQHGDLWYFQAMWDPGVEAHTVLGVGNRNGVHGMLIGVLLAIAGMIYAFYVKPTIIRRRKEAALAAAGLVAGRTTPAMGESEEGRAGVHEPEVTHV